MRARTLARKYKNVVYACLKRILDSKLLEKFIMLEEDDETNTLIFDDNDLLQ